MNARYNTRGRAQAQVAAPGARQRGMVQNAAITGALTPSPTTVGQPSPGENYTMPVREPDSRPQQEPAVREPDRPRVTDTPPAPLGAPTPGQNPTAPGRTGIGSFLGGGFGDAQSNSLKHQFGRLASHFNHTPSGLQALVNDPEFKQLFPTATLSKDWIDFGGQLDPHTNTKIGKIDVQRAWDPTNDSGTGWQWLTEEEALGGGGQGVGGGLQPLQAPRKSYAQAILEMIMQQNQQRGY